jgi:hypothetical protein
MDILGKEISVARILSEDSNFITLEVAKSDQVSFTLNQDDEGNVIGGDKFLTLLFVRPNSNEDLEAWKPWQ